MYMREVNNYIMIMYQFVLYVLGFNVG